MLNIIIFSKDRACQLELLIRSMKFYFKEFVSDEDKETNFFVQFMTIKVTDSAGVLI